MIGDASVGDATETPFPPVPAHTHGDIPTITRPTFWDRIFRPGVARG